MKSIPWDKVDIRVITLEICRKKLNKDLTENHIDLYPEIIEFLESKGYKEVKLIYHGDDLVSQESVFARTDLKLNYD